MTSRLAGITVVAVEQAVAAPYASSRLADAGARVIKVERPGGDFAREYDRMVLGQSAYFVWLNRGKESVCLDIKSPADRSVVDQLIARADVFIHNLKPGSMERIGLGSAALRARHPRLITCEISGFGATGEQSGLKAYDLIVQAESGLCSITGNSAGPARVGVSVCDIAAGMTAHSAILEALFARERTGHGTAIQVSLFDAVADWMNVPVLQYLYARYETKRNGVNHPSLAPYGAYRCADDQEVILSVQNDREWVSFCTRFLARPDLIREPRFHDNTARIAHRDELDQIVRERFDRLAGADAIQALAAADIACGRLRSVAAVASHPHVRLVEIETPAGRISLIAPPALMDGITPTLRPVAALGQYTAAIRAEFADDRSSSSSSDV